MLRAFYRAWGLGLAMYILLKWGGGSVIVGVEGSGLSVCCSALAGFGVSRAGPPPPPPPLYTNNP